MPPTGAPIQELPIITTENGIKSIYAFHVDLKQLDLGYQEARNITDASLVTKPTDPAARKEDLEGISRN